MFLMLFFYVVVRSFGSVHRSFGGKLHIGFVDIRNKLDSILEEREKRRLKRREEEDKVGR